MGVLLQLEQVHVNVPIDVNSPLFGFCQFYGANMENMSSFVKYI